MKKKLLLFLIFLSQPVTAWNSGDHRAIAYFGLQEVSTSWGLAKSVEVHPLKSLLTKLPMGVDSWRFSDWLRINPSINLEHLDPEAENKKSLTPLEILTLYSTDPDDGRDQDLFSRDEKGNPLALYPDQKWFGALDGANSQAFRHLEKPPFSIKTPFSTFGFPFRAVGEATRRAEIWFELSLLAFDLQEDYWGWRFLANSFHYLQDLHQPFHAGQVTPSLLCRGFGSYLVWGHEKKGMMGTIAHLISNLHRFYETYVQNPGGEDHGGKERAINSLIGTDLLPPPVSVRELARQIRDDSNRDFPTLIAAITEIVDPKLLGPFVFTSDGPNPPNSMTAGEFLKKGPAFEATNRKIFAITQERFSSAGRTMRTVVRFSLDQRGREKSAALIRKIDSLLTTD